MNKREKQVIQYQLDSEKEVIEQLTKHYQRALDDINRKIRILQSDELTQSRVYRIEYQKALKMQVEGILEKLHSDEYTTIQQFLSHSYTDAFVGTVYDMFGQGVPFIMPIDNNAAVKAVITDSKISEGLYEHLGVDTKKLKNSIRSEITRGIAAGLPHSEIARNIAAYAKAPLSRAKTIVRTESHRIQQASRNDAQQMAKSRGADVVKQWDSTLDGKTRSSHRRLDGQIRELDEYFEIRGKKARYPGDFGDPAEDCNCRCQLLQRSRLALDEEELKALEERAKFFGLDKSDDFEDFRQKYLKLPEKADETGNIVRTGKWAEGIADSLGVKKDKIQLDELPSETQSMIFRSVQKSIDRFPQLKGHFNRIAVDHVTDALAVSSSLTGEIKVSKSFLDFDKLKKDYSYGIKLMWHPEGTNVESVFTHEIGHQIDGLLTKKRIGGGYIDKFGAYRTSKEIQKQLYDEFGITKALSEARKNYRSQGFSVRDLNHAVDFERRELLTKYSCEYASQSSEELFACLYAEYMDSQNPRPMAKRFGEILEGLMGELK